MLLALVVFALGIMRRFVVPERMCTLLAGSAEDVGHEPAVWRAAVTLD